MTLVSRNIYHNSGNSNRSAVMLVRDDLVNICGSADTPPFDFLTDTYYNVQAEITGTQPNHLVIVGAHLDSTAANEKSYDKDKDDAPGADDDASGVHGVLMVADQLVKKGIKPKRTIRFVVFNAEEYWIRGSSAYAKALHQKAGITVAGVIAMDMILWHRPGSTQVEIHSTGDYDYPGAKPGSDALAAIIEQAVLNQALTPQKYPLPGANTDPANERSDHSSFQMYDWPACLVCEDFWSDGVLSGPGYGNPNYHKKSDLTTAADYDWNYATAIINAVAEAAWNVANL